MQPNITRGKGAYLPFLFQVDMMQPSLSLSKMIRKLKHVSVTTIVNCYMWTYAFDYPAVSNSVQICRLLLV